MSGIISNPIQYGQSPCSASMHLRQSQPGGRMKPRHDPMAFLAPAPASPFSVTTAAVTRRPTGLQKSTFTPLSFNRSKARHAPSDAVSCDHAQRRGVFTPLCMAAPEVLSLADLQASVDTSLKDATSELQTAATLDAVEKLRVKYLGKKGLLTVVMKSIGKLSAEDRPKLGSVVNVAKQKVTKLIATRKEEIEANADGADDDGDWLDVDMPSIRPHPTIGRIHPINSTIDIATDIFVNLGYDLIDETSDYNREIEEDYYCFEALNCPPDHPARDMQDTLYITEDKKILLRSQTSSVQVRYMKDNKPPFRIIAPGRVYRRDAIDATHFPQFHQIEILAIEKRGVLTLGGLRATVIHFLEKMLGEDIKTRFRASYFPFTEPSMEVDVFFKGQWLEVLGCGMVDPNVLEEVDIDPEEWVGFAAGFGVERFAMVMHEITDIRTLYNNDVRFLHQGLISTEGCAD